ncbi:MAG: iron-sulfur cluster assembly accessory protein [Candidatus Aenigmarchaeota archaeon]|nr:iron-sulfur cluster assembly accessory protein [Candidatus Aenigmarchaeota archaeon]
MTQLITKDMTVGEVIMKYPNVVDILQSFGLHCVGCQVNTYETIEQGTVGHGMSKEEMENMIIEANDYLNKNGTGADREIESEHTANANDVVVLTQSAATKVKSFMQQDGGDKILKVSVNPGGCAGFTYGMAFEEHPEENEMVFEQNGVKIAVDKAISREITGLTIDYVDSLQGSGFKISNPKAKASCGCGKSFR